MFQKISSQKKTIKKASAVAEKWFSIKCPTKNRLKISENRFHILKKLVKKISKNGIQFL